MSLIEIKGPFPLQHALLSKILFIEICKYVQAFIFGESFHQSSNCRQPWIFFDFFCTVWFFTILSFFSGGLSDMAASEWSPSPSVTVSSSPFSSFSSFSLWFPHGATP